MININTNTGIVGLENKIIHKVKSIIITTDVGNIILTPRKDTIVSLTTTETYGMHDYLNKKEATIETQYDNLIVIS